MRTARELENYKMKREQRTGLSVGFGVGLWVYNIPVKSGDVGEDIIEWSSEQTASAKWSYRTFCWLCGYKGNNTYISSCTSDEQRKLQDKETSLLTWTFRGSIGRTISWISCGLEWNGDTYQWEAYVRKVIIISNRFPTYRRGRLRRWLRRWRGCWGVWAYTNGGRIWL